MRRRKPRKARAIEHRIGANPQAKAEVGRPTRQTNPTRSMTLEAQGDPLVRPKPLGLATGPAARTNFAVWHATAAGVNRAPGANPPLFTRQRLATTVKWQEARVYCVVP